jgi:hypothetical protein
MAEKVGTSIVLKPTAPATCEECGNVAELRPYGPGGKNICIDCGMKDPEGTQKRMMAALEAQLEGATHVVVAEGIVGEEGATLRVGHLDEDLRALRAGLEDAHVH